MVWNQLDDNVTSKWLHIRVNLFFFVIHNQYNLMNSICILER